MNSFNSTGLLATSEKFDQLDKISESSRCMLEVVREEWANKRGADIENKRELSKNRAHKLKTSAKAHLRQQQQEKLNRDRLIPIVTRTEIDNSEPTLTSAASFDSLKAKENFGRETAIQDEVKAR